MMVIRKLRLQRGWPQEQLSQISGLSIRTIQRIEQGQKPSLESVKSLAAVFETTVAELQQEPSMNNENMNHEVKITEEERKVIKQVRKQVKSIKGFYSHLFIYVMVITGLFIINYVNNPENLWAIWPAIGWGIGIIHHGLSAFKVLNFFDVKWEKRQIEKRLNREKIR